MAKPNFTGTWNFNPTKSLLQIKPPDSSTFVVEHAEPDFRLTRTHIVGKVSDTFTIDLTTDGKQIALIQDDIQVHARAYWEGESLIFYSTLTRGEDVGTNVVRYTLTDNLNAIVAEEHFRGKSMNYDNVWVLERSTLKDG